MKLLKFALAISFCFPAFFLGSCDKGTDPDDDPPDTTGSAPFVLSWSPENGATNVPRGTALQVSIGDSSEAPDSLGADSVSFSVNSVEVSPSLIRNAHGGFDIQYTPSTPFDWGDTVIMSVRAVNTSGKMLQAQATFFVEIGDTFSFNFDSLSPISGSITRSRPSGVTIRALYFASAISPSYTELEGSPYHVAFTPKRSWILYDPSGDVWAVNPSLGLRVQLTDDPAEEKYPALSPNGYTLAFGRGGDVILKNLQTAEESVLATSSQGGREMDFSPDGEYIAYRSDVSYNPKLYIRRVSDGTDIVYSTISNNISDFDWSHTHNGVACIASSNRVYYWDVEGGTYPRLLRQTESIKFVAFDGLDNVYFVEQFGSGDKIMKSTMSGTLSLVLDLTTQNATVNAIAAADDGGIIFAKRSYSGTYSLEHIPAGGTSSTTITNTVGNTLQIEWF